MHRRWANKLRSLTMKVNFITSILMCLILSFITLADGCAPGNSQPTGIFPRGDYY